MWKLVLTGAAFAALMAGCVSAAELPVPRASRAPQSTRINISPSVRHAAAPVVHTRLGNLCWVSPDGAWYHGFWQSCPQPVATRMARRSSGFAGPRGERRARKSAARRVTPGRIRATRTAHTLTEDHCRVIGSSKQYWATSLSDNVDSGILQGLQEAVTNKEVGWLDVDPKNIIPPVPPNTNVILYHVGGNCYIGSDCDRFPSSKPTGDRWGDEEREIDLNDPQTRKIVIDDLIKLVRQADELAPNGATVGVHVDNVHKLDANGLAQLFNEYLQAVKTAKEQGLVSKGRTVGYIAKNNPLGFRKALDDKLLRTLPLYQINENAKLDRNGELDPNSRAAQSIGQRYNIPVFLKTFGTDVAYTIEQDGKSVDVLVSEDMTRQMAKKPHISGAAWSADEERYQPTLYAQGAAVKQRRKVCDQVALGRTPALPHLE